MPNYILLERIELNASAASIVFNNIPQSGYTDLKVVASARTDRSAAGSDWTKISFNGVTSNLSMRALFGGGSSVGSYTDTLIYSSTNSNSQTASTFGSTEFYIPNYTGSTNKSVSAEGVSETNASTNNDMTLVAGLWSSTAAITSITLAPYTGPNFLANSTFSLYGLAALGTTPVIAPKASGGNRIDYDGTYWIHTFLTSGTFTPQQGLTCDYLVVAGGGGGGRSVVNGAGTGGGGAGGLRSTVGTTGGGGSLESALTVASGTTYTVTIGAGGAGATSGATGSVGADSVFASITSTGGGGGGQTDQTNPTSGGSGGGAGRNAANGAAGTANQGFAGGGAVNGFPYRGGGGGGAGAVGVNGSVSGNGGAGVSSSITGTSVTRAGGGGGGAYDGGTTIGGTGGTGGGGNGGGSISNNAQTGTAGTTNTGGGGGGGGSAGSTVTNGQSGGSGIVIIRYLA